MTRDDEPTQRRPVPRGLVRYLFIPGDYRLPCIAGWMTLHGFVPDEPLQSRNGFLVRLKG